MDQNIDRIALLQKAKDNADQENFLGVEAVKITTNAKLQGSIEATRAYKVTPKSPRIIFMPSKVKIPH